MIELGDAFIAMPGGIGTLEEITEVLTLQRDWADGERAFLYNINGYYANPSWYIFRQMVEKEFCRRRRWNCLSSWQMDELDEALRG